LVNSRAYNRPWIANNLDPKENRIVTNRETLEQAGLLAPNADLTQEQWDAIDSLTDEEVDALISTRAKLGPVFQGQRADSIFFGLLIDQ
jgi:hypothetical protein